MIEELAFWGSIASIVGVGIAIFLTWYVIRLGKRERKSDEEYYKTQTTINLQEISKIFIEVIRKSKGKNTGSPEEEEEITISLDEYFSENYGRIKHLIQHSEMCLGRWISLSPQEREKITETIRALKWLIEIYFPQEKSINTKQRIWTHHYSDLNLKRDQVNEIVNNVLNKK